MQYFVKCTSSAYKYIFCTKEHFFKKFCFYIFRGIKKLKTQFPANFCIFSAPFLHAKCTSSAFKNIFCFKCIFCNCLLKTQFLQFFACLVYLFYMSSVLLLHLNVFSAFKYIFHLLHVFQEIKPEIPENAIGHKLLSLHSFFFLFSETETASNGKKKYFLLNLENFPGFLHSEENVQK